MLAAITFARQPASIGLVLGLLMTLVLGGWFIQQAGQDQYQAAWERMALIKANALADLVARSHTEQQLQTLLHDWGKYQPNSVSARVVRINGARLLASSFADEQAPRRLKRDEKALYDLAKQLAAAVDTNRNEGVFRKKQVVLQTVENGGVMISVPYRLNARVTGMLQLVSRDHVDQVYADNVISYTILCAALLTAGLLILYVVISLVHKGLWSIMLTALSVFLLIGWFSQQTGINNLVDEIEQYQLTLLTHYQQVKATVTTLSSAESPVSADDMSAWDSDLYQRPLGIIGPGAELNPVKLQQHIEQAIYFLKRSLWASLVLGALLLLFIAGRYAVRTLQTLRQHQAAYLYIAPAMIGMLLLVFFPFTYGVALSFTDTTLFNENLPFTERWVGWENYLSILGDFNLYQNTVDGIVWNYQNFYWTLFITICWTVSNVTVGVSFGFILAMVLNIEGLKGKTFYRVLLILPWAVPNYISALIWRGMFHPQFGVINQVLQIFGAEPVAWFDGVFSSFMTGLATNGWLSFPFMMVIILGALQSIPKSMYEAAAVEGASRWQRLRYITLPALKPTLIPAIVLSVVWTFNMFNVIFLVSGGEPAGANEILITKAYKIAFENYQYAYAAAYSLVIFLILLAYGVFQTRVTKATESY